MFSPVLMICVEKMGCLGTNFQVVLLLFFLIIKLA